MQVGNVWLVLDNRGSNVPLKGVTPAECLLLSHNDEALNKMKLPSHQLNAGKFPLHDLEITGDAVSLMVTAEGEVVEKKVNGKTVLRTDSEEVQRLIRKGIRKELVSAAFPGLNPKLPQTFSEIQGWKAEDQKIVDAKAPKVVAEPEKK